MGFRRYMPENDKSLDDLVDDVWRDIHIPRESKIHTPKPTKDLMPYKDGKVTTRTPPVDREDY